MPGVWWTKDFYYFVDHANKQRLQSGKINYATFSEIYNNLVDQFCKQYNCIQDEDDGTLWCTENDFLIIKLTCPDVIKRIEYKE